MGEAGQYDRIVKVVGTATTDKGVNADPKEVLEKMSSEQRLMRRLLMRTGTVISDLTLYYLENNSTGDKKVNEMLSEATTSRFNLNFFGQLVPDLDGKQDPTAEVRLRRQAELLAMGVANRFRQQIPEGATAQYFTGSWGPGFGQEQHIDEAMFDKNLRAYLKEATRGIRAFKIFQRPVDIAAEMTRDSHFHFPKTLFLNDELFLEAASNSIIFQTALASLPAYVSMPQIIKLYSDMVEFAPEARGTNGGKLIQFVSDLVPYRSYNLRVAEVPDSVSADVLLDWQHQIAVPGVQPDIVGVYAQTDDNEAQDAITAFIQSTKGSQFGRRALLDIAGTSDEYQQVTIHFYDLVRANRIHIIVGEMKSLLTENRVLNGDLVDTSIGPGLLRKYQEGLGFRMWGMLQQAIGANVRDPDNAGNATDFVQRVDDLARTSGTIVSRAARVRSLLRHPFVEPFFHAENRAVLVPVKWPLFRQEYNEETKKFELKRALTVRQYGDEGEEIEPHTSIPRATFGTQTTPFSDMWLQIFHAGRTILRKNSLIERIRRQANENKIKEMSKKQLPVLTGVGQADNMPEPEPILADRIPTLVGRSDAPFDNKS